MTGDVSSIGPTRHDQRGAALLIVLFFLLVATLSAGSLVEAYQTQAQRDKEKELLFVGDQYRRAIASYYSAVAPSRGRSLPLSLDDLVRDNRFPVPVQHLRRHYPDPITGRSDWAVVLKAVGSWAYTASPR